MASVEVPRQPAEGGRLPGYQGYIPGAANVYGVRYTEATSKAFEYTERIRKDNGIHPFHLPHLVESPRPQYCRYNQRSQTVSSHTDVPLQTSAAMPPLVNNSQAPSMPRLCQSTEEAKIPGYSGYVPAVQHVYAHRYSSATVRAAEQRKQMELSQSKPSSSDNVVDRSSQKAFYSEKIKLPPGYETSTAQMMLKKEKGFKVPKEVMQGLADGHIPGYQGFVPALKNHVTGQRFASCSEKAGNCFQMMQNGHKLNDHINKDPTLTNDIRPHQMPPIGPQSKKERIIGYAGYVPAIKNHIFAVNSVRATTAAESLGPSERTPGPPMQKTESVNNPHGCMPGYTGFIPGFRDMYGLTYTGNVLKGVEHSKMAVKERMSAPKGGERSVRPAWQN